MYLENFFKELKTKTSLNIYIYFIVNVHFELSVISLHKLNTL